MSEFRGMRLPAQVGVIGVVFLLPLVTARPKVAAATEQAIPVFDRCDVLVVDGSLAACVTAWQLAQTGKEVVLTTADASLPCGIAVWLRPWAAPKDTDGLPAPFRRLMLSSAKGKTGRGELILNVAKVCEEIEDLLIDAGVRFYFGATPCGVVEDGDELAGVVFAGKFGLGAVEANAVVDCTPQATVAAMAGTEITDRRRQRGQVEIACCLLCENAEPPGGDIGVDECDELVDGKIIMHGPVAEFRLRVPVDSREPFYASRLVLESRRVLASAIASLSEQGRAEPLVFSRTPDGLLVQPTVRIRSVGHVEGSWKEARTNEERADLCRSAGVRNLWVCGATLDVGNGEADSWNGPWRAGTIARVLAAAKSGPASAFPRKFTDEFTARLVAPHLAEKRPRTRLTVAFGDVPPLYGPKASIPLHDENLPVAAECDVLVVGGGTSGVPAALAAAGEGMRVILIEKHSDLGGTHTIGGVSSYWFGRDTDFRRKLDAQYTALTAQGLPKAMAMTETLRRHGITVLPKCLAAGVVMDGETVHGVVVTTPAGLAAIRARVVIDATGDGDLAAWSGAPYDYGSGRDAMTLWCSFGEFKATGTKVSRQYDSVVDLRDPADYTRAIVTGRRRPGIFGTGEFPQHYLTVRESRRIRGRKTVTYGGILAGEGFADVVLLCRSNFDIKGIASSDLARCGYVSLNYTKNFNAAVPYGALLPQNRENLLVIGKAYSVTHDALSLARMQRDLMAMGGVAGLAAAQAIQGQTTVSRIDVTKLQSRLAEHGIVSREELNKWSRPRKPLNEPSIGEMVARLAENRLDLPLQVTLLMQGERALPALRKGFSRTTNEQGKLEIARALCYLEDTTGVPPLLERIRRHTANELPSGKHMRHRYPDHGWAPEPVYLIYAVGLTRDPRFVPVLGSVAEKVVVGPDKIDSSFEYVMAICQAAERSGTREIVPLLENLAARPGIRGSTLRHGEDPRKSVSIDDERRAYLELAIARALARCGSPQGYRVLIDYLEDMRAFLARSAHDELAALAGEDFGHCPQEWLEWLERHESSLSPEPYRKRIE